MNSIKGWKNVFKFTYMQMVRSKSYIISTSIIIFVMLLMALGINFLPGLLAGNKSESGEGGANATNAFNGFYGIETLYISDKSGLDGLDFNFLSETYSVEVNMISENEIESITTRVNQSFEAEALIEISKSGLIYNVLVSRPSSDNIITSDNCFSAAGIIGGYIWNSHMLSIGVPEDKLVEAAAGVGQQVTIAGEAPKNEIATMISSMLPMLFALIFFMFIFLYGTLTAQSIATEKTSRVMETLLTSVRPMAIILGKVLGMGLASLTQFTALITVSFGVSAAVAPAGTLGEIFGSVEVSSADMQMVKNAFDETFSNFNAMSIVWIVIIFVLGFLFYSLIAGLFGASISRMEDLQSGMQPFSLIGVLGFYLAYISPAFSVGSEGVNIMEKISYYLPISSPFALPGVIITGVMNTTGIIISILTLIVFDVLMLMFVARVYETIILHTGNRIKIGAMFKMAKKK